jgi:hypothetical protein
MGEASTTGTSVRREGARSARDGGERAGRMGHMAVARQSGIRVRDETDEVAATRRCGGKEGAEGIRRFFFLF